MRDSDPTTSNQDDTGQLVLARHAESELDAQGRFSCPDDPDLSACGERKRAALSGNSATLARGPFDFIFHSRCRAAAETADKVFRRIGCRHSVAEEPVLDERGCGKLAGMTSREAETTVGCDDVDPVRHQGAEADDDLEVVQHQSVEFFRHTILPLVSDGESVLIVSYNDNLRAIAAAIDHAPLYHDRWRTGMALDYAFAADGSVVARDAIQTWDWTV